MLLVWEELGVCEVVGAAGALCACLGAVLAIRTALLALIRKFIVALRTIIAIWLVLYTFTVYRIMQIIRDTVETVARVRCTFSTGRLAAIGALTNIIHIHRLLRTTLHTLPIIEHQPIPTTQAVIILYPLACRAAIVTLIAHQLLLY